MTITSARRRNQPAMLRCFLAALAGACLAGIALAQPAAPPMVTPLPPVNAAGSPAPTATRPQPGPLPGASAPAAADPADRIVEVRIEGNHATETAKLPQLVTRAGQIFDPQAIEQDVRTLHRSRKFVDVKPKYVRIREGVVVIFQVVERPMLRHVKYVGNRQITTRVLRKKSEIDVGDAMDPYIVEEARRRIESHYHEKGYDAARVTTVEGNKPGDTGAVFLVDEGRNRKVAWTGFVGNTIASDARLLTQIKSKPGILWLIGGDVDRSVVDEDVDRLTAYYRSLGFFQARVGREIEVLHEGNKDWVHLTYVIHEGPRYTVRNVSFVGNSKFKTEFLEQDLKMRSGEHFNQSKMDTDLNTIRDIYGGRGFVFADVKADPRFLEQPGQLDLVYSIEEGQQYRVGAINVRIRGGTTDPHTRHSVVMNRLSLRPGDILDIRKLRDDERRLKSSGLFLADAAKGEGPKIAFSKPENDDRRMARDPDRPGFRGQSPDGDAPRTLDIDVAGDWHDAPVREESPTTPTVWRGQNPMPQQYPQQQYPQQAAQVQQPYPQQGVLPQPFPQQGVPMQPQAGWAQPPQAWGGVAAAPGVAQPLPPVYTVQQPVAPAIPGQIGGFPGQPAQPGGCAGQQQFPVQPVAQYDPNQPPGFQPPALPDFGGSPLPVFPGNDPFVMLDVEATETQTGRLMIGAGVNSNAGLVGNIVVDEQNFDILRLPRSWDDVKNGVAFRGAGQRFRLEASPGTQLQRYMATFQEPYLFDTRIGLSLSASYYTRAFFDWAESRTGGRIGLGYQFAFAPDLSVNAAFRGESVDVFNPRVPGVPEIQRMLGTNSLYGFSAGLIHDTRDSPFMPTQGHLATFEFEQVIGTFLYPRGILEGRQYFLLNERPDGSGRHVLSVGSVLGMSGPDTPAYDNFFAGGYNTLRGFTFRGASPREAGSDGQLAVVGGPFQWLNTVEYMFPITADDTLRGVVFTDFGTVESNVSINNMRVAPGVGMRITLPAMGPAPIALDFAFPVVYAPYDSKQIFSFFVGFAR
ncbi:MAG: POTRA domain-containing protein [Planctomycetia bacterium]